MEKKEDSKDEIHELLQTLDPPTYYDGRPLVKYNDFWSPLQSFRRILSIQRYFKAKDSDIILTSFPKSGTTWLKALAFSIAHRNIYTIDQNPLLTCNPHALVPFLEHLQHDEENPDFISTPRIFATHIPFKSLPDSIRESKCRIIYVCRNPLDQFISGRHFYQENKNFFQENKDEKDFELCESFDMFCQGISPYGPLWDHMLGYWNAHLKNPEKVLFLKYEDLKQDITFYVKKIAEFVVYPFSVEEEKQGLVEEIARLCSFDNLKNLEVNKTEYQRGIVKNSTFFRKGEVGDWANYLSPAMAERFQKVMESKLEGSGLMFNI